MSGEEGAEGRVMAVSTHALIEGIAIFGLAITGARAAQQAIDKVEWRDKYRGNESGRRQHLGKTGGAVCIGRH